MFDKHYMLMNFLKNSMVWDIGRDIENRLHVKN